MLDKTETVIEAQGELPEWHHKMAAAADSFAQSLGAAFNRALQITLKEMPDESRESKHAQLNFMVEGMIAGCVGTLAHFINVEPSFEETVIESVREKFSWHRQQILASQLNVATSETLDQALATPAQLAELRRSIEG